MLVDLNLLMRPRLFIMDAVVAMEGNGPARGTPRQVGLILASDDPVALDATVCYLIGLNPELVPTIRWGEKLGLGDYRTMKWLGESPDDWIQQGFRVNRSVGPTSLSGTSALAPIARNFLIPKPVIDEEKCTRCGQCVDICPVHPKALQFPVTPKGHVPRYDYSACIRCYCCHETCPSAAIRIRVPLAGRILH
jgi:Pyruvate/2-oxoacid:ferredoxin oxidoreductase delta subunit